MKINLKEESYYSDIYDLATIKRCLAVIDFWKNGVKEDYFKNQNPQAEAEVREFGSNFELYYMQGECFQKREATIKEWMDQDRKIDEKFESAVEPQKIRCVNCLGLMKVVDKSLGDSTDQLLKVLFMFECPKCQKRQALYDDGKEYVRNPDYCPKCRKEIRGSFRQEDCNDIWEKICEHCGFTEKEVENIKEKEEQREAERVKNKELLKKYRTQFCLSSKEGTQYALDTNFMKEVYDKHMQDKQREVDPDYQKVIKLKKLGIVELQTLLSKELKKQKYINLSLDKPLFEKYVVVPFTVQDADPSRKERNSEYKLRNLIKRTLIETNWHLMTEGVSYRLGYLSGRLKGYEKEEDLLEVVKRDGGEIERNKRINKQNKKVSG